MRVNDVKLALPVVDRDIEQCAIIKIIAVVEVREIVRKLPGPKAWMRHGCDQPAIRSEKPGDLRQVSKQISRLVRHIQTALKVTTSNIPD